MCSINLDRIIYHFDRFSDQEGVTALDSNSNARRALGKPPEVADYLGVPEKTLTQWRYLGKGPKHIPVGRHVRYRWSDVEKWLEQQAQRVA